MSNIKKRKAKRIEYIQSKIKSKDSDTQVVLDEEDNELHGTYLVTLNQFNYMVKFDVPIEYHTIQFCGHLIGFDYEVGKLGDWEYNYLRNHIPCINIKTDGNHVSHFWATTKLWKE